MKVLPITFDGGKYSVFRVLVGKTPVGAFHYVGTPDDKPWQLTLEFPGIKKGPFMVANQHAAEVIVKDAVFALISILVESAISKP